MRVIPDKIPGFAELNLPAALHEIVDLRNGIVLVTGPTGSGKSSTLAAILDKMNEEKSYHILTIEDLEERATGTPSAGSSGSTEIEIERLASQDKRFPRKNRLSCSGPEPQARRSEPKTFP